MRAASIRLTRGILAFAMVWMSLAAAVAQTPTARIVKAANSFLATLDQTQRKAVLYAFDDAKQRVRWSNLPVSMVPRGGIALKDMTPAQQAAAMALLKTALSARGYEKVQQILVGDEILRVGDPGNGIPRGGGAPSGLMFGKELFYISFLGTPSETAPWMLQFGGHHLGLNVTIAGEHGILTPTLTAAQPAMYRLNGQTVRPLGQESDKGLALLNALDDGQRKQAIIGSRMADLVLGPGEDGRKIQPEGLKGSAMNERQRAMMLDVMSEWAGIVHESAAATRMEQLKAELNDTWFCWSGPTNGTPGKNISSYYRIQGPHVVIEYAPQMLGGDASLHVHTMYRDPTNDYGFGVIKK